MNFLRGISWALLLGATILSGPNIPAQVVTALREALFPVARRLGSLLGLRLS